MQLPFPNWLHDTVSALIYSVADAHADLSSNSLGPPYNDLTQFVLEQHRRMPDYLRLPMETATLAFDLSGLLRNARRFHSRAPGVRAKQIAAWKKSNFAFARDFVRYHESLAVFGLYSREFPRPDSAEPNAGVLPEVELNVIAKPAPQLQYEVVVVGSGPGGAITACILAEGGRNVLLVEQGHYHQLESCPPFSKMELEQKYRNGGQTMAFGEDKIAYVEGCCVGGGSEVNSGLYHRTPTETLEAWRKEFRVADLQEAELRPHFEAIEKALSVSLLSGPAPAASLRLHQGAARLGWKSLEVPRWFSYEPTHAPVGRRQSMTRTFIPVFLRSGGSLLPLTRIERIRLENGKWILEGTHGRDHDVRILAETLILAGGAVQTPALLRRNGMTRNIGNSLRVHPTVKVVAEFPEPVNSPQMGVPVHQVKEFAPRLSLGCSVSTPAYLALGMLDHAQHLKNLLSSWPRMASYYAMITPEGSGTVRSFGSFKDPAVSYSLTEGDRRSLADGLAKLSEALFAAGAVRVYPCLPGIPELLSAADLKKIPEALPRRRGNLMTIHLFSSCPMGEDRGKCATDSFGRVHGFKNLHISDASLLCGAPGVNPQGSVMAVARRNALHLLGHL